MSSQICFVYSIHFSKTFHFNWRWDQLTFWLFLFFLSPKLVIWDWHFWTKSMRLVVCNLHRNNPQRKKNRLHSVINFMMVEPNLLNRRQFNWCSQIRDFPCRRSSSLLFLGRYKWPCLLSASMVPETLSTLFQVFCGLRIAVRIILCNWFYFQPSSIYHSSFLSFILLAFPSICPTSSQYSNVLAFTMF